jgi:putative redox protein
MIRPSLFCSSGSSLRVPITRLFSTLEGSTSNEYIKSYQLNATGNGARVEMKTNTGHFLSTDLPKKMGGSDTAPQPVETLLAAWTGCTQATALFVGRHLPERLLIEKLQFENIEAFRDERGALELPIHETPEIPSRLQRVSGIIRVFARKNKEISPEQLAILKEQTEIRCPVANMMTASGCSIDVVWVDGSIGEQ